MEARSLSALNALAANPPQYPEKPNEERQPPLVLYISRVPGTRDIILSPFKPQLKNVTAEDVANSLYYVHLHALSSDYSVPLTGTSSDDASSHHTIPRKPLPDSARPPTPESLTGRTRLQPPLDGRGSRISWGSRESACYPSRPSQTDDDESRTESNRWSRPTLPPLQTGRADRRSLLLNPIANQNFPPPARDTPVSPDVPRRPSSHYPPYNYQGLRAAPTTTGNQFTLTLIRRDPASGNQWNVGRVMSRQPGVALESFATPVSCPKFSTADSAIDIEIETSGYAKFRRLPARRTAERGGYEALLAAAQEGPLRKDASVFSRQVAMRYSKSWTANFKNKLSRFEHVGRTKAGHARNGSTVSTDSAASWISTGPERSATKPRGYTFTSPWDGRCEFRTGHGGRSVQCRHMLRDGTTTAYNPLVAEQQGGGTSSSKPAAETVSELRFNLPASEVLGEQAKGAREQWRGNFGKLLRPATSGGQGGGNDDDAVSPFEVNFGKERAGGGNRGTRVKLGKLIVYHDGLKMLDLVVAANIGVWWEAWEKMF
ncbi:oxidoreductase-like protein [Ophiocordyceps camponoti-floridani]|uniref:Oxidoreductase-like protein n=1 Tax=Ophiocordyceps camponoti-floridani TaxID=2030778 RepID=A0A8H4VFF9_9HYPO|nr:oxidoreductase-like protein [Ophiocordyceps camponoti-floridani]